MKYLPPNKKDYNQRTNNELFHRLNCPCLRAYSNRQPLCNEKTIIRTKLAINKKHAIQFPPKLGKTLRWSYSVAEFSDQPRRAG